MAASCYGTFVLAESGLLDGRAATTSWWFQEAFAARYPQVHLHAAKALVDDGQVITAGAMTAHEGFGALFRAPRPFSSCINSQRSIC